MNLLDVLYTPLDCPDTPKTDIPKLLNWIDQLKSEQNISNRVGWQRTCPCMENIQIQ